MSVPPTTVQTSRRRLTTTVGLVRGWSISSARHPDGVQDFVRPPQLDRRLEEFYEFYSVGKW
jgi:hypothetical protein